jgi:hypothetical protein
MWPSSFASIPGSDLFVSCVRPRCPGLRAVRSGTFAVLASLVRVSSRFDDLIQFGCSHTVGFGADSTGSIVLQPAARESPRDRSGFHPYTKPMEIDCRSLIALSAETSWPHDDHASPIDKNRRCCRGCPLHGTDTSPPAADANVGFIHMPRCRFVFDLASESLVNGRTVLLTPNATPWCDRLRGRAPPSALQRSAGLDKTVDTNAHR